MERQINLNTGKDNLSMVFFFSPELNVKLERKKMLLKLNTCKILLLLRGNPDLRKNNKSWDS